MDGVGGAWSIVIGEVLLGASQKYLRSTLPDRIPQKQMRTAVRVWICYPAGLTGWQSSKHNCVSHQHKKYGGHSWGASTHLKEYVCMALRGLKESDK